MSHDSSLETILRAVEPAARLVPERHLRKVITYLTDAGHPLPTRTDLPFWVSRVELVEADVLPARVLDGTESHLLLITEPDDRLLHRLPRDEQLRVYWRVLFQAAVMREIDRKLEAGHLTAAQCAERLNQFGAAAAREIEYVLEAEHHLNPEAQDPAATFRAFAAAYFDLREFAPHQIDAYFPSLPYGDEVGLMLGSDVDGGALLARTRPDGAAAPPRERLPEERWTATDSEEIPPPEPAAEPAAMSAAQEAEQKGNNVRAAILRVKVARAATGSEREAAAAGAVAALRKLVDALGDMFGWDVPTRQEWVQSLGPLLQPAAAGVWPRAARCLYELQKLPADLSRDVYAVDLPEFIRTFTRRPVRRHLPHAKPVLILMGLGKARAQMLRAGLGPAAELRLDRLFHHQIHELELAIRRDFTPIIVDALARAGLVPVNAVEEVGRDKLVAELLDRICERGYLRIGNLRDAIARNRMKMGDLRGPIQFLRGDALLKADVNLAYALDGVYRKGEFYLRWLQRASSLFFANPLGRILFLYLLMPFGAAFMTVVFTQEMAHIGEKVYGYVAKVIGGKKTPPPQPAAPNAAAPVPTEADLVTADEVEFDPTTGESVWDEPPPVAAAAKTLLIPDQEEAHKKGHFHIPWPWVIGLGVFIFFVIHIRPFRSGIAAVIALAWWAFRGMLWDLPMAMWRSRTLRAFRNSRGVRFLFRHFWVPSLLTVLVCGLLILFVPKRFWLQHWNQMVLTVCWVWAGLTIAYNTRWGWVVQDRIAEYLSDWWRVVRVNLVPGLIATFIDWFRRLANWFERRLYAVDEWFRYRGGDSRGSFALKAVLGLVWFPIAYAVRFAFNLLIEPQINPVKHFPVVTVSHKLLLPLVVSEDPTTVPTTFGQVVMDVTGWGVGKANFWAFWIIAGIPGIFGFIAWELLANWRLYRANRASRLRPVTIGSHGESMRGLLRPGFHSGTVAKLFRKLRHASPAKARRLHIELEHSAEGVLRFVERELVPLLTRSPEWGNIEVRVRSVDFGCQRATIKLAAPTLGPDYFVLAFENVGGRIEAAVEQTGWFDRLSEPQRATFVAALRGLLDMATVERVGDRERSEDAPAEVGLGDLARRVTWADWVARWNPVPRSVAAAKSSSSRAGPRGKGDRKQKRKGGRR